MVKIKEAIVVEGRYDKNTLSQIVDAPIFETSGFGIFRINGNEYQLGPGEMFIIPPYVETYYRASFSNPWNYIWVGFNSDNELLSSLPPTMKLPEAAEIFNSMKRCEDLTDGRTAFLTARLWDLFACISDKGKEHNDYVKNALDFIHNEYMHQISIGGIADKLNIDRTYLYTIFKKKVGISPKQYLKNHRMNMAASLIRDNNLSVSIAGYSVGYTDIFTFSKMFKKHFGVSPSDYKTNLLK